MKSTLIKIYLGSCLFWVSSPVLAQNAAPTVVSVGDGDTLRIREVGQVTTIRLGCIDAPERAQSLWGQQLTSRLKQLLPTSTAVQVRKITRDAAKSGVLVAIATVELLPSYISVSNRLTCKW